MVYRIDRIIRDVRVAIDQNTADRQLEDLGDRETLELNETIGSKIKEGARSVLTVASPRFLEEGHILDGGVCHGKNGSGWILLPDDFMRLLAFRMSDWERTLYEAITPDDPLYELQSSRYGGIRGNPQKPVCAIVNRQEGKALEFYSCRSNDAYMALGLYLPYPTVRNGSIDISERCYEAVVYMTAALTLTTYGETERAQALEARALTLAGVARP